MSQWTEGRTKTYQASAALAQYLRVRLDGSLELAVCGAASTDCVGTMWEAALAADQIVSVVNRNAQGSQIMVASGAITAGNDAYAAAGGKIASSGTVIEPWEHASTHGLHGIVSTHQRTGKTLMPFFGRRTGRSWRPG